MVSRALRNAGFKVGLNVSPHLLSIRERIQINGAPISKEDFADVLGKVFEVLRDGCETTFFEAITSASFLYFLKENTDYQVFEVGLGGRLDATNVVLQRVGVITRIHYDHTSILGDTLEQIAEEKAGIIKSGSPVITPESNVKVLDVISKKAKERGSKVIVVKHRVLEVSRRGTTFETDGRIFTLPLLGRFQAENGALAYHVLKILGVEFDPSGVVVPGRMQVLRDSPLLLVDGAHNPVSSRMLVESLKRIFPRTRFNFVLAFSRGKDYHTFLKDLIEVADWIFITRYPWRRSEEAENVARVCYTLHGRCSVLSDVSAIQNVIHGNTVITGSLYLLGNFLKWWWSDGD